MRAILKNPVTAEGETLPAGTICEVEKIYPDENGHPGFVDLFHETSGILFWEYTNRVELTGNF